MQYMNGPEPVECDPQLIDLVLTTAITVHRSLGPGLLESIYQRVMERELQSQGLIVASQCPISVIWKGEDVGMGFRADLIVECSLLLELKAVQEIIPLHIAQVITYLKMTSIKRGFILNFNIPVMKKGIKRLSSVPPWSKSSSFFSKRSDGFLRASVVNRL
ncbi:MAG: GxxExxY protein [Spirochaetae bacterium HGW-Spirochaetae-10]|nr:MAG: GxxExxY protein [Spirochaetae bacterium HGW-Spirochaetae-10]